MQNLTALLVHHNTELFRKLAPALARLSVTTRSVGNCGEACEILAGPETAHLVFTETILGDGNWADLVARAAQAPAATNVIVVARIVDLRLYTEALEAGAFDYIVPPFYGPGFEHVVRCAGSNVLERRKAMARHPANVGPQEALFPSRVPPTLEEIAGARTR